MSPRKAQQVGRFGVISGTPSTSTDIANSNAAQIFRHVKEPHDKGKQLNFRIRPLQRTNTIPVPIYDLTNLKFNPETDFFDVASKFPETRKPEVTTTEPVIVAYYLTRWRKSTSEDDNYDLSIQWVGQLLGKV